MATARADDDATIDLGVLDELVGYHLRRASGVIAGDFHRVMAGTGMRQVLFGVLSIIAANPGINQGAVGRGLAIRRANMVGLVNELVDSGLVRREAAADDRRAFALTLTASGEVMFETGLERIRAHERNLMSDMTAAERATLFRLLDKIEAKDVTRG